MGLKAPIWFFNNVLRNIFETESNSKEAAITKVNEDITKFRSDDFSFTLCERKYRTANVLQKHMQNKREHLDPSTTTTLTAPVNTRSLRKRRTPKHLDSDEDPPPKTLAMGSSVPTSRILYTSTTASASSGSLSISLLPSSSESSLATNSELEVAVSTSSTSPLLPSFPVTPQVTSPTTISQPPFMITSFLFNHQRNYQALCIPIPPPLQSVQDHIPVQAATASLLPSLVQNPLPSVASISPPLPSVPAPPAKPMQTNKNKVTLALTPEAFEKENLKVECDACRMDINKLASEKKDLRDSLEILTTRCRLLEQERNNAATRNAMPTAIPTPTVPTRTPASPTNTSPRSSLETLINLEVLKAVKAIAPSGDLPSQSEQKRNLMCTEISVKIFNVLLTIKSFYKKEY